MGNMGERWTDRIWDLVFPPFCVACGAAGSWWCRSCLGSAQLVVCPLCPDCGSWKVEHACPRRLGLDGLVACGYYHDPKLRAVLQALKYRGVERLVPGLSEFLRVWRAARRGPWPWSDASGISIQPLIGAPSSVRARGFDQAEILAQLLKATFVPWAAEADLLVRRGSLAPQAKLAAGLRPANVAGAFSVRRGSVVAKNLILVDDVVTSGATLAEAAKVLRAAGAERIFGFALALGA